MSHLFDANAQQRFPASDLAEVRLYFLKYLCCMCNENFLQTGKLNKVCIKSIYALRHIITSVMYYSQICQIIILCLRTKKQAKHLCAQQALDSFVQFRDTSDGTYVSSMSKNTMVRKEYLDI